MNKGYAYNILKKVVKRNYKSRNYQYDTLASTLIKLGKNKIEFDPYRILMNELTSIEKYYYNKLEVLR